MTTILELKLTPNDIHFFCECCTALKNKGIHIEVGQDNKVICGSSFIGLGIIDFDKPVKVISHKALSKDDIALFIKWEER